MKKRELQGRRPVVWIEVRCLGVNDLTPELALRVGQGHRPCLELMEYPRRTETERRCVCVWVKIHAALRQGRITDMSSSTLMHNTHTPLYRPCSQTHIVCRGSWHPVLRPRHSVWHIYTNTRACSVPFDLLPFLSHANTKTDLRTREDAHTNTESKTNTLHLFPLLWMRWCSQLKPS